MRGYLLLGLLLVMGVVAQAEDKANEFDVEKLEGQWVLARLPNNLAGKFTKSFTKDGKYTMGGAEAGALKLEGTYKLEGDKLTIKFNDVPGVPGDTEKYVLKKLTDKEMVLLEGRKAETYKKVK
jgi:uncharacterized protein (TIGR03066 family)